MIERFSIPRLAMLYLSCLCPLFLHPAAALTRRSKNPRPQYLVAPEQQIISTYDQHIINDEVQSQSLPFPSDNDPTLLSHNPLLSATSEILDTFPALVSALEVMQSHFYALWQGTWPDAIDWTAAVMGTQVSATLIAISEAREYTVPLSTPPERSTIAEPIHEHENLINQYFTQITSFYFGENAFSLRTQAFDDMLWVVLGWLESIKFIHRHSDMHYTSRLGNYNIENNVSDWYAHQFIPSFAHRARLFYDLASQGWDTSLCGGGMIWSPWLTPYKNAITNQLFIAASVSMYLYFPGDSNPSPFSTDQSGGDGRLPPAKAHNPKYLKAAVDAYEWLRTSNMTNEKGLFVDGFHISGWRGGEKNGSIGSGKCDVRDEMVYTYNQGVLLSGLRGLWDATGSSRYLLDGHHLINNVIAATGWDSRHTDPNSQRWAGLGRDGILEESCDATATCSQNGQTFKGIFFHHLTLFCAPLPQDGSSSDGVTWSADAEEADLHREKCRGYALWIRHNALAAMGTRDGNGVFGMWWGGSGSRGSEAVGEGPSVAGTDYRNLGVPDDELWRLPPGGGKAGDNEMLSEEGVLKPHPFSYSLPVLVVDGDGSGGGGEEVVAWDPNSRGRGRTVETQSGGLAVLRALWKFLG